MSRPHIAIAGACVASLGMAFTSMDASGQGAKSESKGVLPMAAAGDQVIVKREAARIESPHKYKVSLAVEPVRSVTLTAPFDGIVRQVDGVPNSRIQAQTEVIRLDNTVARLGSQRADAALKGALAEQKLAADKDELHKTLAQARVDIARAEADLAKYLLEQASIRTPYAGELQRVLVSEGQSVRAGDPLAIIADTSKLRVEVPAERAQAVQGKTLPIKIEAVEVEARIEAVLPLDARFAAVRDVFESVAAAVLVVDNVDGKFKAGQTVYVPLIPRQPVAEVPSSAIGNQPDGQRKVQVVRHAVVRDIPVVVMGSVGINRLFVSGAFAEGDEILYEASHQLQDGFVLKPAAPATAATPAGATGTGTSTPAATPTKPAVGF